MYNVAREAESNLSLLDHPTIYRELIMIEHPDIRDSVTQQSSDWNFSSKQIMIQTQLLKHHIPLHAQVKIKSIHQKNTRKATDAPVENEDTSNARYD